MPKNDFNGDGRSDILWLLKDDVPYDLAVSNWLGTPSGGFVNNDANAFAWLTAFHTFDYTAAGDFNGDGRTDLLWRVDGDGYSIWFTGPGGAISVPGPAPFFTVADDSWSVAGAGDFNGDGKDDLLWRNDNGTVSNWLGNGDGSFTVNDANALTQVANNWQIVGTGDFNGDGRADILWQSAEGMISNWLAKENGGYIVNDANALANLGTVEVLGIGDFNGDGLDDLLWRGFGDEVYTTLTAQDGAIYLDWSSGFVRKVSQDWDVAAIGDYNGDGTDDILWRNDNGNVSNWLGIKNSGYAFTINDANALNAVSNDWHVVDNSFL